MVAGTGHHDSTTTPDATAPAGGESGFRSQAEGPPWRDSGQRTQDSGHRTQDTLAALPEADHPILTAYLRHDADLFRIAEAVGRPIHDVLQALSTAPLRDYVAQATNLADEADRRLSAATLRDTIKTTDSPIEKRRAASALGRLVQINRSANAADRRSAAAERAALLRPFRGRSTQAGRDDDAPPRRDPGPSEAEPPPLRAHAHLTPGESVAAFLINVRHPSGQKDLWSRIQGNISMFIRMDDARQRDFTNQFNAAYPLLERGPWRTEPAVIDGDAASVRTIFTRDDGTEAACTFHLVKAQLYCKPTYWFVDGIDLESG